MVTGAIGWARPFIIATLPKKTMCIGTRIFCVCSVVFLVRSSVDFTRNEENTGFCEQEKPVSLFSVNDI